MKHEVLRKGSGTWVTYLSIMLSIALMLLTSSPVLAQATPTEDQYATEDQYLAESSSLGERAAFSAFRASRALDSDPTAAQAAAQAADQAAARYGLTKLPATGGTPPLWFGILLVAGGVLTRRITR